MSEGFNKFHRSLNIILIIFGILITLILVFDEFISDKMLDKFDQLPIADKIKFIIGFALLLLLIFGPFLLRAIGAKQKRKRKIPRENELIRFAANHGLYFSSDDIYKIPDTYPDFLIFKLGKQRTAYTITTKVEHWNLYDTSAWKP